MIELKSSLSPRYNSPTQTKTWKAPRVLSPSRALNSSPFALLNLNENKCVAFLGGVGTAYIVVYLAYWGLLSKDLGTTRGIDFE